MLFSGHCQPGNKGMQLLFPTSFSLSEPFISFSLYMGLHIFYGIRYKWAPCMFYLCSSFIVPFPFLSQTFISFDFPFLGLYIFYGIWYKLGPCMFYLCNSFIVPFPFLLQTFIRFDFPFLGLYIFYGIWNKWAPSVFCTYSQEKKGVLYLKWGLSIKAKKSQMVCCNCPVGIDDACIWVELTIYIIDW